MSARAEVLRKRELGRWRWAGPERHPTAAVASHRVLRNVELRRRGMVLVMFCLVLLILVVAVAAAAMKDGRVVKAAAHPKTR